ncbi:MAG: AAA family ATPase [Luteolibacter sp.]
MIPNGTLDAIRDRLNTRSEDVCRLLLPGGKRKGKKWVCGDISGNPGSSLEVELEGPKVGVWNDFATGNGGNFLKLWQECRGVDFRQAAEQAAEFVNLTIPKTNGLRRIPKDEYHFTDPDPAPPPTPPQPAPKLRSRKDARKQLDWEACVAAVTAEAKYKLSGWRGISLEFVEYLVADHWIGLLDGNWALPVHDTTGKVVRAHFRTDSGDWMYSPGTVNAPLIIGNPAEAATTFLFESQWDAFAALDALGYHDDPGRFYAVIITRGASSNLDLAPHLANSPLVVAVPQNDPPGKKNKEGRTPAEEWLYRIRKSLPESLDFRVAATPKDFKDVNDWVKAKRPARSEVESILITKAQAPDIRPFIGIKQLLAYPVEDDPNCVLGKRWLCRGGSLVIVGPSGAGKSTLMTSMMFPWAAGDPWHGISPKRPLRQLIVQAENDEGDIAEMTRGAIAAIRHDWGTPAENPERYRLANENLKFTRITDVIGEEFCKVLERQIRYHKADLVWIDPLLSYVGDDISKQDVASRFLRNWLNPVLERTGAVVVFIHHSGKPSSDAKARSHWTTGDYAYLGLGSSEITNWARAVMVLSPTKAKGIHRLIFAKRGGRSQVKNFEGNTHDGDGKPVDSIFLSHDATGRTLSWSQCQEPVEEEEKKPAKREKSETSVQAPRVDLKEFIGKIEWPAKWQDAIDQLAEATGEQVGTVRTLLGKAIKSHLLFRESSGYYYLRIQSP